MSARYKTALCHPDRLHDSHGLCGTCARKRRRNGAQTVGATVTYGFADTVKNVTSPQASVAQDRERDAYKSLLEQNKALREALREAEDRYAYYEKLGVPHPTKPLRVTKKSKLSRECVPHALFSDWHVEENVLPERVSGLNEYNLSIAEQCIEKCTEAYVWQCQDTRWDMRTGVVWYGGDLFSGYIHEELAEENALSPVEAVLWLQDRIVAQLRSILQQTELERVIVVCNDGNHGRLTRKMRQATRTANSLEWLMYKTIAHHMKGEERLTFQIADGEYNYLDLYDATECFFHGDSVQYLGGVGGLLVPLRRGLNELRKYRPVHHFALGHFHTYTPLEDIAVNGSMIGVSPYSMSKKFAPERRQQSMYLWDSSRGKCMATPIWLDSTR